MKRRLKDKIVHWIRERVYCCFMNYDYLDRYKEKGNIEDIERFLRYSSDIQQDIEELVSDGYYYAYSCDGEPLHAHSFKGLCVSIVNILLENPDAEFCFDDDNYFTTYSSVDLVILDKLIRKIRELMKA